MRKIQINAANKYYTELNQEIRKAVADGADEIIIDNVLGQRFLADGLMGNVTITIHGIPGADLKLRARCRTARAAIPPVVATTPGC